MTKRIHPGMEDNSELNGDDSADPAELNNGQDDSAVAVAEAEPEEGENQEPEGCESTTEDGAIDEPSPAEAATEEHGATEGQAAESPGNGPAPAATIVCAISAEQAHLNKLRELGAKCVSAHASYVDAKERAAAKKKTWEALTEELQEAVLQKPEELPLFDQAKGEAAEQAPVEDNAHAVVEETDDSWRLVSLLEAGVPANLCEKLAANEPSLQTVGELSDWVMDERNSLIGIKGIGEKKADQIEEALIAFWAARKNPPASVDGDGDDGDNSGSDDDDSEFQDI